MPQEMDEAEIKQLVAMLDTAKSLDIEKTWGKLRGLGEDIVPYLAEFFPKARRWQGRVALIFYSIRYARTNETAFRLGLNALEDRAFMVRYRACGLLAYSLREDALPALKTLLSHKDYRTVEDAQAAICAIKHKNHHYFMDRNHTEQIFWTVNELDNL